jgi:outer membrane protein assembly factor BamB
MVHASVAWWDPVVMVHWSFKCIVVVVLSATFSIRPANADWPAWRGADRNAKVEEIALPENWPERLRRAWSVEVGEGHSSPVVQDNLAYQFSRLNNQETLSSINLDGKLQWRRQYAAPYEMNAAAISHGKGPKATPAIANGRIVTFGIGGVLTAWNFDGQVVWRRQFDQEFKATSPLFGTAMSPLIVHEKYAIAHVGGHDRGALRAFNLADGKPAWSWEDDGPAYASPILVRIGEQTQLVTQTQNFCVGMSLQGELRWKIPFTTDYDQNSVTPIDVNGLLVFSGYNRGLTAYRITERGATWTPEEVWHNDDVSLYMSSPVALGNRLYGLSHFRKGQLFCVDATTGKTHWTGEGRQGDNAALLALSDGLAVLTTTGRLTIFKDRGDAPQTLATFQVSETPTWAHPVFTSKGVLIKDANSLSLWTWE